MNVNAKKIFTPLPHARTNMQLNFTNQQVCEMNERKKMKKMNERKKMKKNKKMNERKKKYVVKEPSEY